MSVRLILARHGETASNVARILDTALPGAPLNERGLRQAAELGERLEGDRDVVAVYASRATRAQQTAAAVGAALRLGVTVLDGVHEVFCGDLEGRSDTDAREKFDEVYDAWWAGDVDARLPGGESARDVHARFLPAVESVTADVTGTVVLASHGAAIRLAASALLGEPAKTRYLANTGLVILARTAQGWALEHWDEAQPPVGDVTAGAPPE